MAQTYEFYRERAAEATAAAKKAKLDNVRERELRSAKTWRDLADKARKSAENRATKEAEQAVKRAQTVALSAD